LVGAALYDRLELPLPTDPNLVQATWRQRELENYVCQRNVLLSYASWEGQRHVGELFANAWEQTMEETIGEIEDALRTLGEPSPWGPEIKASDAFLDRVFKRFYEKLKLPNLMSKTDYHELANHLDEKAIDPEIGEKLDLLMQTE